MDAEQRKVEARGVARRPVRGSYSGFLRDMVSLLRFRALKRTAKEVYRDDVFGLAAELAFYLTLGLFPFLLVLFSLMGTFSSEAVANQLLGYFFQILPPQIFDLLATYTSDVLGGQAPRPGLLSFGIIGTVWAISNAFAAIIKALNQAYDVEETRPFWKVRGLAILMALGLSGIILLAVVLLIAGPPIGQAIADYFGFRGLFEIFWGTARWVLALGILVLTFALLYYSAPNVRQPFRWITAGGFVGVTLWVLASLGFRFYVDKFRLLRQDLRLHRCRHRAPALPLHRLPDHLARRRAKLRAGKDERRDLRQRGDPGQKRRN